MSTFWPDREEWTARRIADLYGHVGVSTELADYATPEEIAAAIVALQDLYAEEGRTMKAAKVPVAHLYERFPDNTVTAELARCHAATKGEDWFLRSVRMYRENRKDINEVLDDIRQGTVPVCAKYQGCGMLSRNRLEFRAFRPAQDIVRVFGARWDAAYEAARCGVVKQLPDEEWRQELARRAHIDATQPCDFDPLND